MKGRKKKKVGPKKAVFSPFSRGKKVSGKQKQKKKSFSKVSENKKQKKKTLIVLAITVTPCQVVPGLSEVLLVIFYHSF